MTTIDTKLATLTTRVLMLCGQAGIQPIAYGSFAYRAYTDDTTAPINDIDLLVPESAFKAIIPLLKKEGLAHEHAVQWHTLIITEGDARVELDGLEYWLKAKPKGTRDATIDGLTLPIIGPEQLLLLYERAAEHSKEKPEEYRTKLATLKRALAPNTDAITLSHLTKTFRTKIKEPGIKGSIKSIFSPKYRETHAVKDLSLTIPRGQLVGFIGPNGAGKSTTLKMLTGILYPTSGEANVAGFLPWKDRKKLAYQLGTVFGQRSQLWLHLPAQDSFDLLAAIYGLNKTAYHERLARLAKEFEIGDLLDSPVRKLSLGQRMRCELVAALLHRPEILYLDEPTIGLDILAKKALRQHISRISKEEGVTVIFTSHDMDDIEAVCERVVVINHGQIVHDSSFEEMRKRYLRKKRITVLLRKPAEAPKLKGVTIVSSTTDEVKLEVDTDIADMRKVLAHISEHYAVDDIDINDPPIEEIIEEIYGRKA